MHVVNTSKCNFKVKTKCVTGNSKCVFVYIFCGNPTIKPKKSAVYNEQRLISSLHRVPLRLFH